MQTIGRIGLALLLTGASVSGQGGSLAGDQIIQRSQAAFFAAGDDLKARVVMKLINQAGKERLREMTMLRRNLEAGDQKYFIYFHRPADVREMTFMVWRYPGRDDDRWLFVPAIKLVRRIAADDSRSSFVGSDFTYEDVSGRDRAADTHALSREEVLDGQTCYVVESTPKEEKGADYARKVAWIDQQSFLPLKEEYYNRRNEVYRVFTADEVKEVGGFPTVVRRTMKDLRKGHRTEVAYTSVEYDLGLSERLFSERSLRRPPAEWIR